jgi:hypothetical protein
LLVSTTNGDVMKIFLAGERRARSAAILFLSSWRGGHEAVGTTRSAAKTGALRALGAEPVIFHAPDPDSVADVVAKAEPNPPADAEDGVAALRHLQDGVTP